VELTHDYGIAKNGAGEYIFDQDKDYTGLYKCYVMIPDNENGNMLRKTDKGWTAYTDETASEDGKKSKEFNITDERIEQAWDWIEDFFENLVNERHEMLDDKPTITNAEPPSDKELQGVTKSLTHIKEFKMFEGMEPTKQTN